jgi:hypothetical protein
MGKYKGKPLSVLQNDTGYVDWLLTKPWLKEKYPTLYTVIINNFNKPDDTPEHNLLQADFLKDIVKNKFSLLFYNYIYYTERKLLDYKHTWHPGVETGWNSIPDNGKIIVPTTAVEVCNVEFEKNGWDVIYTMACDHFSLYLSDEVTRKKEQKEREEHEWYNRMHYDCYIELKPEIGDDYPSILRDLQARMRGVTNNSNYVFCIYENISSVVPVEDITKMFRLSHIYLISKQFLYTQIQKEPYIKKPSKTVYKETI